MDSSGKYPSEGISNNPSVYYSCLLQRKTVVRNSCGADKFVKNDITSFKLSNIMMTMSLLFLMKILSLPSLSSLRNGNLQKSHRVDHKESGRVTSKDIFPTLPVLPSQTSTLLRGLNMQNVVWTKFICWLHWD